MNLVDIIKQVAQGVVDNAGQTKLGQGTLVSASAVRLPGEPADRPCKQVAHPPETSPKAGDTVAVIYSPDGCIVLGKVE